jgi:hypothetical protein
MIGIMIRGTLVSMKAYDDKGKLTMGGFVNTFMATIEDIEKQKRRWGKSVVNIPQGKSIVYRMTFVHANYFIVRVDDDNQVNDPDRIGVKDVFEVLLYNAERVGIVVVVTAGDQVGTVILMSFI